MRTWQSPRLPSLPSFRGRTGPEEHGSSLAMLCQASTTPRAWASGSLPGRRSPVPATSSPGVMLPMRPQLAGKSWPKLERREVGHGPRGVGGDTDPSHLLPQLFPH